CPSDTPDPFFWAVGTPEKFASGPSSAYSWQKGGGSLVYGGKICQVASANYVGMFGLGEPGVDGEGLFYRNSSVSFAQIRDGLSQTIAVGERGHDLGYATWVGSVTGATLFNPDGATVGRTRPEPGAGMTLGHAGEGVGPGDPNSDVNMFFSRHGGGVNFVFADGHVSFLKTTMNASVFAALATRSGGEVIQSP
ncbi:MAG TPA: DUF1559 domain-containing protein, partial [Isosphaeraceae bacterium]|nr:DUF1559 domain-containing protein [Isosphaeraceae bacterium]